MAILLANVFLSFLVGCFVASIPVAIFFYLMGWWDDFDGAIWNHGGWIGGIIAVVAWMNWGWWNIRDTWKDLISRQ